MTAVIHVLDNTNNDENTINLFHNQNLFDTDSSHFLITRRNDLNKKLYSNFEQIFYINNFRLGVTTILSFLKSMNYKNFCVVNSDTKYDDIQSIIKSPL